MVYDKQWALFVSIYYCLSVLIRSIARTWRNPEFPIRRFSHSNTLLRPSGLILTINSIDDVCIDSVLETTSDWTEWALFSKVRNVTHAPLISILEIIAWANAFFDNKNSIFFNELKITSRNHGDAWRKQSWRRLLHVQDYRSCTGACTIYRNIVLTFCLS